MNLKRPARTQGRGGALLEFVLGMTALVPLIFYLNFVNEQFFAAFRAQEAEWIAGWDLTAYRYQNFSSVNPDSTSGYYAPYQVDIANDVAANTAGLLADMDSFADRGTSGQDLVASQVSFSAGSITCGEHATTGPIHAFPGVPWMASNNAPLPDSDYDFAFDDSGNSSFFPSGGTGFLTNYPNLDYQPRNYLHKEGYMVCTGQTSLVANGFPSGISAFAEQGFLSNFNFTFCGLGLSASGCTPQPGGRRGFLLLTGDWSLYNGGANAPTRFRGGPGGAQNDEYYRVGEALFNAHGPILGKQQIEDIMGLYFGQHSLGDLGATGTFKLGVMADANDVWTVNRPGGSTNARLSGWGDGEGTFEEPATVWGQRANGNYLGHASPTFVGQ